ncbi:MAG: endopeptidase La, partial [Bdellovibrionales bacterium]|nr:endopeptidase La [Bdellovibrionales bacterium]
MKDIKTPLPDILPLVPLKNTVVFPQSLLSIYVSQEKSKKALLSAWKDKRMIFTSALENPEGSANQVYQTGCVSLIMRVKEMTDGRIKALIQGLSRAHLKEVQEKEFLQAHIQPHEELDTYNLSEQEKQYFLEVKNLLSKLAQTEEGFSPDFFLIIEGIKNPGLVCDLIISNLTLKLSDSQQALETSNIKDRLILTRNLVQGELLQGRIQKLIKSRISKQKTTSTPPVQSFQYTGINSSKKEEIAEYTSRIEEQKLPATVKKEVSKQLSRLEKMHTESSEASMIRTYLDCVLELPWNQSSEDNLDLKNAEGTLNKDHYELTKVKERVLEFLAVQSLSPANLKGPILCFVGPPGVGKTSLGQSIAKAMGRKYARISLGGVKDEAEIRGHRRTYVGAMPGKIMQALNTCGTNNPVIVLDEVDKLGADFRGDPASALLEVLDPEQNHSFKDHYLNLNFNLSKVLFIATANLEQNIPYALRDRLEIVSISGYTQTEKIQIAKEYLIEKELVGHGLPEKHLQFTTEGLKSLINFYTQEAGLRNLKREISAICRKMAKNFVLGDKKKHTVNKQKVFEILGTPHYFPEEHLREAKVGIATGLAWTSAGGQILHVEAITVKNKKGGLRLTG